MKGMKRVYLFFCLIKLYKSDAKLTIWGIQDLSHVQALTTYSGSDSGLLQGEKQLMLLSLDSLCSEFKDNGGGGNGHGGSSEGSSGSEDLGTPGDGKVIISHSHADLDWVILLSGDLGCGGHETRV